jgi:hypothetical protein
MKHLHARGGRKMFSLGMLWPALRYMLLDSITHSTLVFDGAKVSTDLLIPFSYLLEELEPFIGCVSEIEELSFPAIPFIYGTVRAQFVTTMLLLSKIGSKFSHPYIKSVMFNYFRGIVNLGKGGLLDFWADALGARGIADSILLIA